MKLRDIRDAYETLSGKASEIVRQLSLGGVALVWLFKTDKRPFFDHSLLSATALIFVALILDLLQYLSGTIIWHIYFRRMEKRNTRLDDEVSAPAALNWPTWTFFYLKSLILVFAYVWYIIPFLVDRFVGNGNAQ